MLNEKNKRLEIFAQQIRIETLKQLKARGFGHAGGALSAADVMAVLYGDVMKIDPKDPMWEERDRFVLSKGHAGPALYATLALKGYFPIEILETLNQNGTTLPSHPDRNKTPGVDMSTGSLGQGFSQAAGLAMGFKLLGRPNKVYCIVGDGECNEGQVWEAALFAGHRELDNLVLFIDVNNKQLDGYTDEICKMGDFTDKFRAFGWDTQCIDGHDVGEIAEAIENSKAVTDKPSAIVLNTVKGKGAAFIEEMYLNHHINLEPDDVDGAIAELEKVLDKLETA